MKQKEAFRSENDEIRALLQNSPGIVDLQRAELDQMVRQMHDMWWAPMEYIRFRCDRVSEALRAASATWRALPEGPKRDIELVAVRIAHYRIQIDALASMRDLLKRVGAGSAGAKQLEAELQREIDDYHHRINIAHTATLVAPPFDARGFVEGLAWRGVVMVTDHEGNLTAMPVSKLTESDRAIIAGNRAAVRDAVQALTVTF